MKKGAVSILSRLAGGIAGAGIAGKIGYDKVAYKQKMSRKHLILFQMMNQWVKVKQGGKKGL